METVALKTSSHSQALEITDEIHRVVRGSNVERGWCEVFVLHTTAAVAVNEAADPAVMEDVLNSLDKLVPWRDGYRHSEGNSAAHIKSIMVGSGVRLPVVDGRLALGTWQGVFFMEFDGPRSRKVMVDVQASR